MRKLILCFALIYFTAISGNSQQPPEKLVQWANKNPIEKLHLHFDRDNYLSGQTMWFRAYFYSGFVAGDKSTTLYVELLDGNSAILSRKVFPVFNGYAKGQMELPDSLAAGLYTIRAYSPTMLNHDQSFIYKRGFAVSSTHKAQAVAATTSSLVRLDFFPEGGNFIAGFLNTIAFKATDANGYPVTISGTVKNNKDEIVTTFSSWHDGMGSIELMGEENAGLYAILDNDAALKKFALPEVTRNGVGFHIDAAQGKLFFEVYDNSSDPAFNAAYIVGQSQHRVLFSQPLHKNNNSITGAINSTAIPSGIVHLTVFNKDYMPLAERLCFVNNREYIQPAELLTDTISFLTRSRNRYTVSFKDTVAGIFSVSVTDLAYDETGNRSENIFSRLLLTADLPGYIHNPAWYFLPGNDSAKKAIDLVMLTNGWRRFKWTNFLAAPIPANKYKDPGYITLKGKVNIYGRDRTVNNKELLLFISSADSSRSMEMTRTNDAGEFVADSLVFFEKSIILFSEMQNKKTKLDIALYPGDSLLRPFTLSRINRNEIFPVPVNAPPRDLLHEKLLAEYEAMMKAEGIALSMVTVKTRKKSATQELEERYASGLFSGFSEKTLDFTNTNDLSGYRNVFDYLQARVPGLQVYKTGVVDYVLYYRQRRTLSGGFIPMDLFLDEIKTDANIIAFIPGVQIAMVKVFSTFVGSSGNSPGGALAVYTKKGNDMYNALQDGSGQVGYNGYSIIKEFFAPDYSGKEKNNAGADHRMTLHWNPDMIVNGINEKVPLVFYNNDRTRNFRVVVEGLTTDGKMLMIEKVVSGKAF